MSTVTEEIVAGNTETAIADKLSKLYSRGVLTAEEYDAALLANGITSEANVAALTETATEESTTGTEQGDSTPSEDSGNAFPEATEEERAKLDEIADLENRFVANAEQTLEPKDMTIKYARLGRDGLAIAKKRKASLRHASNWTKKDYSKACDHLETITKMRVAIKDVEVDKYVRIHLFVEAVKPLVPNVSKLSYYQIKNKFLPTLKFDPIELTGEIEKGWIGWVTSTVERQLSDDPLSIKELDKSIEAQKKAIVDARKAKTDKRTPDEIVVAEQRAAEATKRAERKSAQSKIADTIDKAITANHANEADVVGIVEAVMKDHGLTMPKMGFDPSNCTTADCKTVADVMYASQKIVEMKYLRDRLDALIKIVENASIAAKTG